MTCKYCGKEIEENGTLCKNCGRAVDEAESNETIRREERVKPKKTVSTWLAILCIGIGAACLAVLVNLVFGLRSGSAEFSEKLQTLQNSSDELAGRVADLEDDLRTQIEDRAKKENELKLAQQPTDSDIVVDERQNVWIFTVAATGSNPNFVWQRFNTTENKWESINFGLGPACGFTTEESNIVGGRQCKLLANEIDNSYFGLYRCEVTDTYGQTIISAEAKLAEKIPEQETQNVE